MGFGYFCNAIRIAYDEPYGKYLNIFEKPKKLY